MTSVSVRHATPDDAQFLAWAILTATRSHLDRGWFDIALNRPEQECLEFLRLLAIAATPSYWHYSRFLIAEEADRPAATVCAFHAREGYAVTTSAIIETAKTFGLPRPEVEAMWRRGAYMFKCSIRPDNDSWVIENAASLVSARHCGYISVLMNHAIEAGRARGMKKAQTTAFIGNTGAERVVLRAGFLPGEERRDPDFEATAGAPGIRQYVRSL